MLALFATCEVAAETFSTTSEAVLETLLTASWAVADVEETASDELAANVGSCVGSGASAGFDGSEE